jgi:DNA topoisomerase I
MIDQRLCNITNALFYYQLGSGATRKWKTLTHNGVMFPPDYQPHGKPITYLGKPVNLTPAQEELAMLYARFIDTDYVKNSKFNKNFWNDWKPVLGKNSVIQNLNDVDFSNYNNYLVDLREKNKLDVAAKEAAIIKSEHYKFAVVDGQIQQVGNFRVEPPAIFLGRGDNPKLGKIKPRIYPEDITINIGKGSKIPDSLPGHTWGNVIHDNTVEWLASWKDIITGKTKYVWLGADSEIKGKGDANKFDKAKLLSRKIKNIRSSNQELLTSSKLFDKQLATALYLIDKYALRVGNEKGSDETDTVGVTSLRVEHVKMLEKQVQLDFLGKDSVRYLRVLDVDPSVYQNIKEFINGKDKKDQLFNLIKSSDINNYLKNFMKGLSAKVFRTYNSSKLFQKELDKATKKLSDYQGSDKINLLLDEYNRANAKVAKLCNHQKNITKSSNEQIDKMKTNLKKFKKDLKNETEKSKSNNVKIKKLRQKIKNQKEKIAMKKDLQNISLGTSKINYIDPRISIAFIKQHNLPIDKIFSKTLQRKFNWATETAADYRF